MALLERALEHYAELPESEHIPVLDEWFSLDGELDDAEARLQLSDLIASNRSTSICCHAEQDKFWSVGPDGERWEWYRITDDRPAEGKTNCCT